jgi:AraC-like DNA-binding protein
MEYEIPIGYIKRIVDIVQKEGFDISEILEQTGINAKQLDDAKSLVTVNQQSEFIKNVINNFNIPMLGFNVGKHVSFQDFGILGYALISATSLREVYQALGHFQEIGKPMINNHIIEQHDQVIINGTEAYPLGEIYRFAVEDWLGETYIAADVFQIPDLKFTEIRVTFPHDNLDDLLEQNFGCPVKYNQAQNQVILPKRFLDLPLPLGNKQVYQMCLDSCKTRLESIEHDDPLVIKVRETLLSNIAKNSSLDDVADQLHLTPRTLRRRLYKVGTSFRDILSEARVILASQYLKQSTMSPKEIAYMLGYASVTSFYRSFKSHFGVTPIEFRLNKELNGNEDDELLESDE